MKQQQLSPSALAWLRAQTVDCQSCGDVVPAEQWSQHSHEHLMGRRPVLGIAECMERNAAARRACEGKIATQLEVINEVIPMNDAQAIALALLEAFASKPILRFCKGRSCNELLVAGCSLARCDCCHLVAHVRERRREL